MPLNQTVKTVIAAWVLVFHVAVSNASMEKAVTISPQEAGNLVIQDLLSREDYMMYVTDDFTGIHYAEAAVGYAALKFAATTHDKDLLAALAKRYQIVPGTENLLAAGHVDANVYGILPLELYLVRGDKQKLKVGLELADAQWNEPRKDGLSTQTRFWIDDVWMINSLQVQAWRATGETQYLDRAALQTEIYLRELQQDNGLFYHGKQAHFHWGRGNGWVAAGLAELLSELPRKHSRYRFILRRYTKMMDALLKYQAEDGMWRQLIDKPDSWKESSATAMFGFAIATGVERNILVGKKYSEAYQKAWEGLATYINAEGKLREVCVGTGQSQDINYYLQRPRTTGDLHGQAPLLWFAEAMLENPALHSQSMRVH